MVKRNSPVEVVTKFRMTAGRAEAIIKSLSQDSTNVIMGYHAQERRDERDIFDEDVLKILRSGMVIEQPTPADRNGEWKCKIIKKLRGNRDAGVVTIILLNGKLFVKTVEWETIR